MAKGRMIDRKIRSSESFAKLTYRQRDLWQGLIEVADDQGRLPGHPAKVRSLVWGYDDIPTAEVDADLKVLTDAGNILRYSKNGSDYIQLVNWHIYQEGAAWLGPSDYPSPDGWQDRCRYHGKGNEIITENWKELPSELPTPLPCREGDVKGEVKSDVDNDIKDEEESTRFTQIKSHIEVLTGLPALPASIKAIEEIIGFGGLPVDITAGYGWFKDNSDKPLKYYGQLVGPTRTAMSKRLGGNGKTGSKPHRGDHGESEESRRRYAELP